jgi:hypothetical protein
MVPGTVDETRCAVWAVLTETEEGQALILEDFGRQITLLLRICCRKMPSQAAGAVAAQRGRTSEQISNHLSGAKGGSSPAAKLPALRDGNRR